MPLDCAPDCGTQPRYTKSAGLSPLPGYVLLEPLGRGGFGEVWKCEAPGGLHKAVKFVTGDTLGFATGTSPQLRQEFEAFQRVKAIRHPFLLSLERVELVDGELVMVMELADRQLGDRLRECRAAGLPGVPRAELLGYLREAAEALDVISAQYNLQHLDVKPANLFLTGGHVQVGDYGLVCGLDGSSSGENRGLTPRYAAPEVLCGEVHTRSDQYSLALVYFELLTGAFPYPGRTAQQIMMQHLSAAPDLSALPEADRGPVAIGLAKEPGKRFESCTAFVAALLGGAAPGVSGRTPAPQPAGAHPHGASAAGVPTHNSGSDDVTRRNVPSFGRPLRRRRAPEPPPEPQPQEPRVPTVARLDQVRSLVPVAWLQGRGGPAVERPPATVVGAVVSAAEAVSGPRAPMGTVVREPDGAWVCRFLTSIDPRVAQVKLDLLWEQGGVTMDTRTEGRVVFRKLAPATVSTGLFGFGRKPKPPEAGLDVVVELPDPKGSVAEVVARGAFFGGPPPEFVRSGEKLIVRMLDGVLKTLNNVPERHKHPRIPAPFPVALYPIHSDGGVEAPIRGRCRDVSAGGVGLLCPTRPTTKYVYVAFDDVPGAADLGVLVQILRAEWRQDEVFVAASYRLDLGPDAA